MEPIEGSLRRLNTEWIDVYYDHRPDPKTPIEERLRALDDLVRAGKVRHPGCPLFAAAEDHYSLLERGIERDVLPAIAAHKLALLPYFPLASGMLTGKYRKGQPLPTGTRLANPRYSDRVLSDANLRTGERLEEFCAARGHTLLQLAFGWLLAKPVVSSVIAGASSPEQVRQNAGATGWDLDAEGIAEV